MSEMQHSTNSVMSLVTLALTIYICTVLEQVSYDMSKHVIYNVNKRTSPLYLFVTKIILTFNLLNAR